MKTGKKILVMVLILTLAISAVGCGVKANDGEKEMTKLEKIQAKGKIVLGTCADYPPYEFHKEINGKDEIVGFDIEIAKVIAENIGVELEIKDMKFDGLLAALVADDIDFIIAGMVPREDRKESVDFSIPYYQAEQKILIKAEDAEALNSIESLKGLKIGAQKSTVQEDIAKDKLEAGEVKALGKITDLVLELMNNKIDGIVLVAPVAEAYAKQNTDLMVPEFTLGKEDGVAVAVNKGNADLLAEIDKTLEELINDGSIDKFIQEATALAEEE
ncbi:transporter substrate-binding domain-containing protein [Alkaliphilus serpentinus]|uniref:Transporter substrate-binding domain-containing protein n=1 Tax=Alkaliphilus serpentinus TaxID=1482731 RepID=A0A833M635_9FIRM|nr:transporter substrate-binding domain-containing protein [Alkaliphilus serpentinus]KAB3526232.1 transporter substrate-binding domain-containing protein [Alkaliphilus serpentinus]